MKWNWKLRIKKRYFKFIKIDKSVVAIFLAHHPKMKEFITEDKPFYVRVAVKPYPALIHHAICQDLNDAHAKNIAAKLEKAAGWISPKRIDELTDAELLEVTGNQEKAKLIRTITNDVLDKKLNLRRLAKLDTDLIINSLWYLGLNMNTLKQFALFGCFKQDVLCVEDPDFIKGLKIYLNKKEIKKQDIINIKKEYDPQLTLFSLCMWRIVNERK